jgi:hypothetical protein
MCPWTRRRHTPRQGPREFCPKPSKLRFGRKLARRAAWPLGPVFEGSASSLRSEERALQSSPSTSTGASG